MATILQASIAPGHGHDVEVAPHTATALPAGSFDGPTLQAAIDRL
jgi:hypothetical protein